MPIKPNEGILMRQVLKWKRKVRITFLPDDPSEAAQVIVRPNDIGEKTSWRAILEKNNALPANFNIDAGITILRFSEDLKSGKATFLPTVSDQMAIFNPFSGTVAGAGIPDSSPEDFVNCVQTRTDGGTSIPEAVALCLSQFPR